MAIQPKGKLASQEIRLCIGLEAAQGGEVEGVGYRAF